MLSTTQWRWVAVAAAATSGAIVLRPSLLPALEGPQAQYREALVLGVLLLRSALVAMAVLAACSSRWWYALPTSRPQRPAAPVPRSAWWCAATLLVVGVALEAPRLTSSLWWDEITSLVLVVRRGPLVIASYSASANNHVLNSALMWLSTRVFGEHEATLRVAPFLMSLAAVQLLFWTLRSRVGLPIATAAGLIAAVHGWVTTHGVEARGYAGAILCTWIAIACFATLLERPSLRATAGYVVASVLAFGFVTTSLLVPIAHGATGLVVWWRARSDDERAIARNVVFACLWVAPLGVLAFGLPLPQAANYARTIAHVDHNTFGLVPLADLAAYVSGFVRAPLTIVPAVVFCLIAALGLSAREVPRALRIAVGVPAIAAAGYLVAPGTHSSSRFFCFLILPACAGAALGLAWLWRRGSAFRFAAAAPLLLWVGAIGWHQERIFTIGRPDLRTLGARVSGQRVALVGAQSVSNLFFFPKASADDSVPASLGDAAIVVEGRAGKVRQLDTPHPALVALGFRIDTTLRSAIPDQPEFVVYRRAISSAGAVAQ